jgi:hypothetical protein
MVRTAIKRMNNEIEQADSVRDSKSCDRDFEGV